MSFRPLTENYIAVATVPAVIASIPSPSKPIERLLKKREHGHNAAINYVKFNCQKHSSEIEEKIQQECERIKGTLEKIKAQIENEARIVSTYDDSEFVKFKLEVFESMAQTGNDLNEERMHAVDTFYDNVKRLERERSKGFKEILRDGYKKTGHISHLLPYDLLNYFETEATKLNEITMSNYRYYAQLHADLKLQMQEEMRVFHLTLLDAKDKYKMLYKMAKIRKAMDPFVCIEHNKNPPVPVPELSLQKMQFFEEIPRSGMDVEPWTQQMQFTLENLDMNAKKLISMYKLMVINVFNRLFGELRNITEALKSDDQVSLGDISLDIYKPIMEEICDSYKCDVTTLQNLWNTITQYMESNIQNTYTFLIGSAHLWDVHFAREIDAKNVILDELKLTIEKNDKSAQSFDKRINTTLDKLREDSTEAQLNSHLQEINKFLDSIVKLYSSQCDSEIKAVQKYYALITQSIDVLISEIDYFLSINAKKEGIHNRIGNWTYEYPVSTKSEDSNEKLIPYQMKACQYQVEAVNNWMFGLWEAIRHYMLTCREELSQKAQSWIGDTIVKLRKRQEVRLATHRPRYLRIKHTIYDVRLKELKEHLQEITSVETIVEQYLGDSSTVNNQFQDKRVFTIADYERKMSEIEESLKKATKSLHVAAFIEQTKMATHETKILLESNFKENNDVINENQKKIERLICHFSHSIKLFVDGGNYSRDEAKLFMTKIQKLQKSLPKKYKPILDRYNEAKRDIMKKFVGVERTILARLQRSKKEFEHNEQVCSIIQELRLAIRNVAYEVKFKVHRLDSCVDYYSDMSRINIWKTKQFLIMKEAVDDCLDKIKELTNILTVTSNGYICRVNGLIEKSFNNVHTMTTGFYATHGTIVNKGKIRASCDEFMKEVKKNYDGFRLQVRVHCLECTQELIKYVLKLLVVNEEVYNDLKKNFPDGVKTGKDYSELRSRLSEESLQLEQKKKELKSQGEVVAIVMKSEETEGILQPLLLELWEHVHEKIEEMLKVVEQIENENSFVIL